MIVLRVAVAKAVDTAALQRILRKVPFVQNDRSWNCLSWVREPFLRLVADDCGKGNVQARHWRQIEEKTREYAKKMRDQRRETTHLIPTVHWWENQRPMFEELRGTVANMPILKRVLA